MDNADFNRIYAIYYRLVMATAKHIINDDKLCEDICQEVFVKLLNRETPIEESEIRYWLLVVTKNTALDFRKKLKMDKVQIEPMSDENDSGTTAKEPLRQVVGRESHREIMDALRKHDPKGMEILIGIEIEGRTVEELAAQYGMKPNNLRTRLYRVRKWIKENFPKDDYL